MSVELLHFTNPVKKKKKRQLKRKSADPYRRFYLFVKLIAVWSQLFSEANLLAFIADSM